MAADVTEIDPQQFLQTQQQTIHVNKIKFS